MRIILLSIVLAGILLVACRPIPPTKAPELSPAEIQTLAAATVDAALLTAAATPLMPMDTPDLAATPVLGVMEETQEFATVTPIVLANQMPTTTNSPTPTPVCPGGLRTNLAVGGKASVSSEPPTANNVRSGPSTTKTRRGQIQPGEVVEILSGPECAEDIIWWEVRSLSTGLTGWTAEGDINGYWLKPEE